MSDNEFRQRKVTPDDIENSMAEEIKPLDPEAGSFQSAPKERLSPLENVEKTQETIMNNESAAKFSGPMPLEMQKAIAEKRSQDEADFQQFDPKSEKQIPQQHQEGVKPPQFNMTSQPPAQQPNSANLRATGSPQLEELLSRVTVAKTWDEVVLPSKGVGYGGRLPGGILNIRPMTGEEEQILATPKYVRSGAAMNMIFKRCIKEDVDPSLLLTADRTFLLIYLRGRSYGNEYEVEIRCSECEHKFNNVIDLGSDVLVEDCPDDFNVEGLHGELPQTGLKFSYRLSTGKDELELQHHRENQTKDAGTFDDTLSFRSAQLLTNIEGLTDKREIQILIDKLPVGDVSHIRNLVNDTPFGVDTKVGMSCPMCLHEFEVEMPMEANFFFPRQKKG